MQFNTTKLCRKKFEPRVRVWKLKGERCEEYQSMVKDKVEEAELKYLDVNEDRQQMKNIMVETAQITCGLSKGPCSHKETWWWNDEVAEAVREKKKKYGNWKKKKNPEAWKEYKKSRQTQRGLFS